MHSSSSLIIQQFAPRHPPSAAASPPNTPPLTPKICSAAGRAMQHIMVSHRESLGDYWFGPTLTHLAQEGAQLMGEIGSPAAASQDNPISPELASQILEKVNQLSRLLYCPLSQHPLADPVTDPAAQSSPTLIFERKALVHFYLLQEALCRDFGKARKATDLTTTLPGAFPEEATLPEHPLTKALIQWLSRYFPQAPRWASAEGGILPSHYGEYTKRLNAAYVLIEQLHHALSRERCSQQLRLLERGEEKAASERETRKQEAERMAQSATQSLADEIKRLQSNFQRSMDQLRASALGLEERVAQERKLREQLNASIASLETKHQDILMQLQVARGTLHVEQTSLADVQRSLSVTQGLLGDTQRLAASNQASAAARAADLAQQIKATENKAATLGERVTGLEASNSQLTSANAALKNSQGGCVVA